MSGAAPIVEALPQLARRDNAGCLARAGPLDSTGGGQPLRRELCPYRHGGGCYRKRAAQGGAATDGHDLRRRNRDQRAAASPRQPWDQWARKAKFDLGALRQYARAVYAATDAYVASLSNKNLERVIDLSAMGQGQQTVAWMIGTALVSNLATHTGEISLIKGLRGARGYPM